MQAKPRAETRNSSRWDVDFFCRFERNLTAGTPGIEDGFILPSAAALASSIDETGNALQADSWLE